jgi:hypothetical protein
MGRRAALHAHFDDAGNARRRPEIVLRGQPSFEEVIMADESSADREGGVCPLCGVRLSAAYRGFCRHTQRPPEDRVVEKDGVRYLPDEAGNLFALIEGVWCPWHRGMRNAG